MAIGYACIHIGSEKTRMSALRVNNATDEKIKEIIRKNLDALENIIDYNIKNNIKLYRISSDVIPLNTHPINKIDWQNEFRNKLCAIGNKISEAKIRVSMHPGQYTVLNSPNTDVVEKAIADLQYHCDFLKSLGCGSSCKIILHIGGVYSDKPTAIKRFIENFTKLSNDIKERLAIENDDKSYTVEDVLYIAEQISIPVVFDNLHHELNCTSNNSTQFNWIDVCSETWKDKDGTQKIHYSQSKIKGKRGSHSSHITSEIFCDFYNRLTNKNIDIMLEVKDKNLSAVKCNLLINKVQIRNLEQEWAFYKYYILSKSNSTYNDIRILLKEKSNPDPLKFYKLIEKAQLEEGSIGPEINAAQHIWGYFKKEASDKEKIKFKVVIDKVIDGKLKIKSIKNFLFKMTKNRKINYLLNSLYFYID